MTGAIGTGEADQQINLASDVALGDFAGRRVLMSAVTDFSASNAASIHVVEMARAFAALGCAVTLAVPRPRAEGALGSLGPEVRLRFYPRLSGGKLPNAANHLTQLRCLQVIVRQDPPDLVYLRGSTASFAVTALLRLFTRAAVVSEQNGYVADELRALGYGWPICEIGRITQMLDVRSASHVRSVTPELARILQQLSSGGREPQKFFHAGNGTNLDHFYPRDRQRSLAALGLDPGRNYVGFIGNFARWQGLNMLLDAFPSVMEIFPDWDLVLIGSGPERARLTEQAERLGLGRRTHFVGPIDYDDAPLGISAFDVAVAPFSAERNGRIGLSPLKIRDYAACGRPIVCADLPGLRELAAGGFISLYPPDDSKRLGAAMADLMQDPARRASMGRRARLYAEDQFSWTRAASEILTRALRSR